MVLDHLCKTPACVNPDHLEAITQRQNALRGSKTRLSTERATELRRAMLTRPTVEVAKEFGVSIIYARRIANGTVRPDITEVPPRPVRGRHHVG
jgi:hypothetical protein